MAIKNSIVTKWESLLSKDSIHGITCSYTSQIKHFMAFLTTKYMTHTSSKIVGCNNVNYYDVYNGDNDDVMIFNIMYIYLLNTCTPIHSIATNEIKYKTQINRLTDKECRYYANVDNNTSMNMYSGSCNNDTHLYMLLDVVRNSMHDTCVYKEGNDEDDIDMKSIMTSVIPSNTIYGTFLHVFQHITNDTDTNYIKYLSSTSLPQTHPFFYLQLFSKLISCKLLNSNILSQQKLVRIKAVAVKQFPAIAHCPTNGFSQQQQL